MTKYYVCHYDDTLERRRHTYIRVYLRMYIYVYIHVHMDVYIRTYIRVYIYIYIHEDVYILECKYIFIHISISTAIGQQCVPRNSSIYHQYLREGMPTTPSGDD